MYLITGSKGQLGIEISKLLPNVILTDVNELDITNSSAVLDFVEKNNIETIINCAGYTNVDKAEEDKELAYKINVEGPKNLALTNKKVIHISTDYVFDGSKNQPYIETDIPNPKSVYGKTKLEGEIEVLKNPNSIVIRTAWLYSTNGKNFVKTMKKLGEEKESLNVVYDQIGTPTNATDLAKAIVSIAPQINKNNSGIYHYSNEGVCSWFDFATEIMNYFNLKCKVNPILSSEYPTKANRPFYSVLNKQKIKDTFNIKILHWKEALFECLKQF